jgi:hypothetical protein
MSKRASGAPRRPRNPVAKAVRTPQFKLQVVADKREREKRRRAVQEAGQAEPADREKALPQDGEEAGD